MPVPVRAKIKKLIAEYVISLLILAAEGKVV
jgi:hypothetical protein